MLLKHATFPQTQLMKVSKLTSLERLIPPFADVQ